MSMFIEKNMLFPFYSRHFLNSSSLIPGHKKSDSENVYSSLKGLGANHIRITGLQKYKNFVLPRTFYPSSRREWHDGDSAARCARGGMVRPINHS